ncbi:MAG TPA: hypothetical protein VMC61_00210, partial [Methanocella sp.]|nr:hypothetical protein [Methanocella sp.]
GQELNVNLSESINGAASTDDRGRFNFSQAVPGNGLPGIHQLTISLVSADIAAQRYTFYGGSILIIPFDKGTVAVFIIVVVVLIIIGLLLIWQRITPGRLLRLMRRQAPSKRPEPMAQEEEPPEVDQKPPKIPDFEQLAGEVHNMLGTGDYREASRAMYLAARGIYDSYGIPISGASTHNEFYREAAARDEAVSRPLKLIIELYEKTNFGHGAASEQDMESAYGGLYDVYVAVIKGREASPA